MEEIEKEEMLKAIKDLQETVDSLKKAAAERGYDIGGKGEAGTEPPKENEEEKLKKDAMKLLEGTGLNPFK